MSQGLGSFLGRVRALPLVRVLVIYAAASWIVLQVAAIFVPQFGLPRWFFHAALVLLLIGLPIILATAVVQQGLRRAGEHVPFAEFKVEGERRAVAPAGPPPPLPAPVHVASRWLTWKKSILGGVLAFTALTIVGAVVVLRGAGRVTEAYGEAGDAFGERAWMIVADFEGSPDEPDVAAAVREALTLDLQQSRYVNVFARSQIDGVLRLMELPETTRVTPGLAREIAQREGLAAALVGTVSRLGDRYVLGAKVLRPANGEELVVVTSTAARDRLVEAVQALSREIRSRLGESRDAIQTSAPLPRVTTRSLEALQRYARAEEALARGEYEQAVAMAEAAIALDPEFAMAHRLAGVANYNLRRLSEARRYISRAYELRDKLSERERLHIEAFYAQEPRSDPRQAVATYELILATYPDDARAANNVAVGSADLGDWERGYRSARRAIELNPYTAQGYLNAVVGAMRLDRRATADTLARLAMTRGLTEPATRFLWWHSLAEGRWARADAVCDSLLASAAPRGDWRGLDESSCGALDVARGRVGRAVERLGRGAAIRSEGKQYVFYYHSVASLVEAELIRGRQAEARRALELALARHPLDSIPKPDRFIATYWVAAAAAQLGDIARAERFAAAYAADTTGWFEAAWLLRLRAVIALASGAYQEALEYDRRAMDRQFGAALVYDQLYRSEAFDGLGQRDSAIAVYEDAAAPRSIASGSGRGFFSLPPYLARLPLVHRRLGELYAGAGDRVKAAQHYGKFLELWSNADPELRPQVEAARRALQQLGGERAGT